MLIQQDVITMRREMLELSKAVYEWQQRQAEQSARWEQQLQALQEVRHQEALQVGHSQARGSTWQAIGTMISAVVAVVSAIASAWFAFYPR